MTNVSPSMRTAHPRLFCCSSQAIPTPLPAHLLTKSPATPFLFRVFFHKIHHDYNLQSSLPLVASILNKLLYYFVYLQLIFRIVMWFPACEDFFFNLIKQKWFQNGNYSYSMSLILSFCLPTKVSRWFTLRGTCSFSVKSTKINSKGCFLLGGIFFYHGVVGGLILYT